MCEPGFQSQLRVYMGTSSSRDFIIIIVVMLLWCRIREDPLFQNQGYILGVSSTRNIDYDNGLVVVPLREFRNGCALDTNCRDSVNSM